MSDTSLFIGDISTKLDRSDLEREFIKYGKLKEVWVAQNPPGFAFVNFEEGCDLEAAIKEMNGATVNGSLLRVERSRGKRGSRDDFGGRRFSGGNFQRGGSGFRRSGTRGRGAGRGGRRSDGGYSGVRSARTQGRSPMYGGDGRYTPYGSSGSGQWSRSSSGVAQYGSQQQPMYSYSGGYSGHGYGGSYASTSAEQW